MDNKLHTDKSIFPMGDPYIDIVKNPSTNKFSLNLHRWDTLEIVDGYSKSDAEELIGLLERGIFHLNNCVNEHNQGTLFEQKENLDAKEEETNTK